VVIFPLPAGEGGEQINNFLILSLLGFAEGYAGGSSKDAGSQHLVLRKAQDEVLWLE
jgi:hypothetical protein